ncbi:MAG: hypothetical protein MSS97_02165 [Arcanobacterium sp.]|nr:hypothetical protein [Arcanobacterium sp.]MDY6142938.1 hypothetical protein [Arcanobacterium sp.]
MNSRKRYVILTPFERTDIVAGILKLRAVDADVADSPSGALVLKEIADPTFDDWDIAELLGFDDSGSADNSSDAPSTGASGTALGNEHSESSSGSGGASGEDPHSDDVPIDSNKPEQIAVELSKLTPYGVVLFRADLGDDVGGEDGVSGLIHAQRYVRGEAGDEISAGMLLGGLDDVVEDLVLGVKPVDEITQIIHPWDVDDAFLQRLGRSLGQFRRETR